MRANWAMLSTLLISAPSSQPIKTWEKSWEEITKELQLPSNNYRSDLWVSSCLLMLWERERGKWNTNRSRSQNYREENHNGPLCFQCEHTALELWLCRQLTNQQLLHSWLLVEGCAQCGSEHTAEEIHISAVQRGSRRAYKLLKSWISLLKPDFEKRPESQRLLTLNH